MGDMSGAVVAGIFFFLVLCAGVWELLKQAWRVMRHRPKR